MGPCRPHRRGEGGWGACSSHTCAPPSLYAPRPPIHTPRRRPPQNLAAAGAVHEQCIQHEAHGHWGQGHAGHLHPQYKGGGDEGAVQKADQQAECCENCGMQRSPTHAPYAATPCTPPHHARPSGRVPAHGGATATAAAAHWDTGGAGHEAEGCKHDLKEQRGGRKKVRGAAVAGSSSSSGGGLRRE